MASATLPQSNNVVYREDLYQSGAKGETRVWSIWVTDNRDGSATIYRSHGVQGGKMNETERTITEGKNIGRSNETTPVEQAIAEAKSTATKKAREGYSAEIESRGLTEAILPMLAHDLTKTTKLPPFPLYIQPKLDGVRMVVYCEKEGSLKMTTRTGKDVFFMDHIRDVLVGVMRSGEVLDGELYTPDRTFEEITGIVRKSVKEHSKDDDTRSISYHVFDGFVVGKDACPFKERFAFVEEVIGRISREHSSAESIIRVPTALVRNAGEADELHEQNVSNGYEGTMYRTPMGPYKIRLRSKDLLKRKDFQTEEYRIIGAEEADGRDIGTVIWVVETDGGTEFRVRPRGSLEIRRKWWRDREGYIGKRLTVRFQNLTEGGIPRFPVGIAIRDYE
jgi:DNA ligase-1